ncbi:MAG: hypothetical protein KDA79_24875, partial [Planctomycetaceae bacterium]|nr:hypothetical protein [Planctomycetaceae bacterium]
MAAAGGLPWDRLVASGWLSGVCAVCCCAAGLLVFGLAGGCAPFASNIVDSPLGLLEQREEILRIAPPGTPREEAVRRLEEAGVRGNAGAGPGIWYCDLWERPDRSRWHLNVALLFDENGRVYAARAAAPGVETVTGG